MHELIISLLPESIGTVSAILLIGASFITSAISVTFGLGGGVTMLAILLTVTSPVAAIPAHALIQTGSNIGRAWVLRKFIMRPLFAWFLTGSLVGILLASPLVVSLPAHWLQLALGVFILWTVWAPRMQSRKIPVKAYLLVGGFTSFLTLFLGATGPILAAFLSPVRYSKDRTVATHAACMSAQHLLKVIAFSVLGFVLSEWLVLISMMVLSGFLGTLLGQNLLHKMSELHFKLAFKIVLTVLALRLVFSALSTAI